MAPGARFVARGIDVHKNLPDVLKAAHAHRGASFVEIFQNCVVYNDDVFAPFTDKERRRRQAVVAQGGREDAVRRRHQGHRARPRALVLKVVDGDDPDGHRPRPANRAVAHMLVEMPDSGFPVALGVIYDDPAPTFESAVIEQNAAVAAGKTPDLQALVAKGQTWQVDKEPHAESDRARPQLMDNFTHSWPAGRSARRGSRRRRARGSRR